MDDAGVEVPVSPDAARVERLFLADFRCFSEIDLELPAGVTVFTGANGEGKTSLLEAVGWASRAKSFRGSPTGPWCDQAVRRRCCASRSSKVRDGRHSRRR
ncbi:MAG: AAA family ATPase [Acidimicrobiia bacterium]|nr:AAA family ATPase [Acidimicrobiia bacterium]